MTCDDMREALCGLIDEGKRAFFPKIPGHCGRLFFFCLTRMEDTFMVGICLGTAQQHEGIPWNYLNACEKKAVYEAVLANTQDGGKAA